MKEMKSFWTLHNKRILSFMLTICMVLSLVPMSAFQAFAAGDNVIAVAHDGVNYTEYSDFATGWNEAVGSDNTAKTAVKLLADWNATDGSFGTGTGFKNGTAIQIPWDKTITLDLNGKTIDRGLTSETSDGYVIYIEGTFTLNDSGTTGKITGGYNSSSGGGVYIDGTGTFTMNDGTISDNSGFGVYVGGSEYRGYFTMNDGTISDNNGGGVYNNGTFTMNDGTISGNSARYGGGVYNGGYFTMYNGTISGNSAESYGGGVYVDSSYFTINNGTISGNSAESNGGGVYFVGATFTMNNGTISGNSAGSNGSGVYFASYFDYSCDDFIYGTVKLDGGIISGANRAIYKTGGTVTLGTGKVAKWSEQENGSNASTVSTSDALNSVLRVYKAFRASRVKMESESLKLL